MGAQQTNPLLLLALFCHLKRNDKILEQGHIVHTDTSQILEERETLVIQDLVSNLFLIEEKLCSMERNLIFEKTLTS